MPDLVRFVFEVVSNVFFVPAITPLAQQRRHFALFVGITQLLAGILYSASDFLHSSIFISSLNWHFISDVLTLTYGCLLLIHLAAIPDEETNVILRYSAFFASWIFKYKDSWDSVFWEGFLVVSFILVLGYSHLNFPDRQRKFRAERLQFGIMASCASFVFFVGQQMFAKTDAHRILMGFAHAAGGWACYELWNVLPAPPRGKKLDDVTNANGVAFV